MDTAHDLRIGVIGNVDSGKSTLIGVLTSGELDDGRGKARVRVFKHRHEEQNGRTSCISQHIMGFDADCQPVYQTAAASAAPLAKTRSWQNIVDKSDSIVTFVDLAGHEKYLKTTIAGLTGCFPHYALVLIGANMGISKMTREHIGIAVALELPICVVLTKIDMAPEKVLKRTIKQLYKILRHPQAGKVPVLIRNERDVATCLGITLTGEQTELVNTDRREMVRGVAPVFLLSSVDGTNMRLLEMFLARLAGSTTIQHISVNSQGDDVAEMQIEETFSVTGVGTVVSGVVRSGTIYPGQSLVLGPFSDASFRTVIIRSVHVKRSPVASVPAGMGCAVSIRGADKRLPVRRSMLRRGMVLIDPGALHEPVMGFEADVMILHHPTTIQDNYQTMVHCGSVRQSCRIEIATLRPLRTGDKETLKFYFLYQVEFIHPGSTIIFREGSTKGIGKVKMVFHGKIPKVRAGKNV